MVVTVVNVVLFCFFAWAYSLTLSSSLSLSDYTDEVLRSICLLYTSDAADD